MVGSRRTAEAPSPEESPAASWTFLTNHAHVLIRIAMDPRVLVRTLAEEVGIRERAVLRIIGELEEAGYLTHTREGRRNVYAVRLSKPLRHPIERHKTVGALIEAVMDPSNAARGQRPAPKPASPRVAPASTPRVTPRAARQPG
jgi:DNA-binding MarR family transcriptional regulator